MRYLTFICYAHQDQDFLDRLLIHLEPYKRNSSIEHWSDQQISAGELWREKIQSVLNQTQAAVLLVSPEFLASSFIQNDELPPLLEAAKNDGLTILWVPVSSSSYRETPIANYQAASDPRRPLRILTHGKQDRALVKICRRIKDATWSLSLELEESAEKEVKQNMLPINGRVSFRARISNGDPNQNIVTALDQMGIQIVPFVFSSQSGWWAQKVVEPDTNGSFKDSVYVGRPGTADAGKRFQIRLCAVAKGSFAFYKGLRNLPPVRIESNTVTVQRIE
jgi:TIR domain